MGWALDFLKSTRRTIRGEGGATNAALARLRRDYPLCVQGVGLSIGGYGPLDMFHLQRFKRLIERYEPFLVSEQRSRATPICRVSQQCCGRFDQGDGVKLLGCAPLVGRRLFSRAGARVRLGKPAKVAIDV